MENSHFDVTAIITAHHEGVLAGVSLKSFKEAINAARIMGIAVQGLVVLDKPDDYTKSVFSDVQEQDGFDLLETDFGDQGRARSFAAQKAKGNYVAFLDGDDLWSVNWLMAAWNYYSEGYKNAILHPEFNWFFEGVSSVLIGVDQDDDLFDLEYLRFGNYWDAMCMAPKEIFESHPYCERDIKGGFAFEDWHWNCVTLEQGIKHKIVPDTIHFKRRRSNSQTIEASGNKSLMPLVELTNYTY